MKKYLIFLFAFSLIYFVGCSDRNQNNKSSETVSQERMYTSKYLSETYGLSTEEIKDSILSNLVCSELNKCIVEIWNQNKFCPTDAYDNEAKKYPPENCEMPCMDSEQISVYYNGMDADLIVFAPIPYEKISNLYIIASVSFDNDGYVEISNVKFAQYDKDKIDNAKQTE